VKGGRSRPWALAVLGRNPMPFLIDQRWPQAGDICFFGRSRTLRAPIAIKRWKCGTPRTARPSTQTQLTGSAHDPVTNAPKAQTAPLKVVPAACASGQGAGSRDRRMTGPFQASHAKATEQGARLSLKVGHLPTQSDRLICVVAMPVHPVALPDWRPAPRSMKTADGPADISSTRLRP
jgi:hypothetical protein